MRGRGKRSWVKFWVTGWLHGSIRWQLDPSERGVWADLICLAGECGQEGKICDNDGRPYPRDFLASQLHISPDLLESTIVKCMDENRIEIVEGVLIITNWKNYQSEYERVKKYREKEIPQKELEARQRTTKFIKDKQDKRTKEIRKEP